MHTDTSLQVRHSHVLGGARAVFRNVFVRPHSEVQVKGVREWYGALSDMGVGLHYVSNAPCELHSVVRGELSIDEEELERRLTVACARRLPLLGGSATRPFGAQALSRRKYEFAHLFVAAACGRAKAGCVAWHPG